MPIAPEGISNILPVAALCGVLWVLYYKFRKGSLLIPSVVFSLAVLFLLFFFRDPERDITSGSGLLLSPADGQVLPFITVENDSGKSQRMISIFLSITNVHVNRSPIPGIVKRVVHKKGGFHPAYNDAATDNTMNVITITNENGTIILRQVVGAVARRVVCNLEAGQEVSAGERIGIMKFGSRMDVIIPDNIEIMVAPGDKVRAGQSIIGVWIDY